MSDGPTLPRRRIVVLASGNGSNFQALVDASSCGALDADIVGLITDRPDASVIDRALGARIPARVLAPSPGLDRASYGTGLADEVAGFLPDLVVLAGWMRLLSMTFLSRFPDKVINLHPALPGEFPGTHAIERALEASQRLGIRRTGVMVHRVPDEGMDDGPVVATVEVAIRGDDTIESLSDRVHAAEHELLVTAVRLLLDQPLA